MVTDPNKQTGETTMPVRKLNETITFNSENAYSDYRVLLKMAGAHDWVFTEANFMDKDGGLVEMKPSQFFNSAWMSATGVKNGCMWILAACRSSIRSCCTGSTKPSKESAGVG